MKTSTIVWTVALVLAGWWLWSVFAKQQKARTSSAAASPAAGAPPMPVTPVSPSAVDYSGSFADTTGWKPPTMPV